MAGVRNMAVHRGEEHCLRVRCWGAYSELRGRKKLHSEGLVDFYNSARYNFRNVK
jgi:hypothetical protein